jgi:4-diphosphocytidyl-2-C-methyl-D-erythritol kinase
MARPRILRAWIPAKVNLGLEVVGRRSDGYHEVVTLLQSVSLYDLFEWTETGQAFEYVGPPGVAAEADLVVRALALARGRARWTGRLRVVKRIPMAAGLGGGSADAALALRLALPDADAAELHARAAELGADVPFFLRGGTALATGSGTELSWQPAPAFWLVLVTPPPAIPDKTRTLYRGLTRADFSDGSRVREVAARMGDGEAPMALPNVFGRQLLEYPDIRYAYDRLQRGGGGIVSVSGAGPTIYALTTTYASVAAVAARLPRGAGRVAVARSVGNDERDELARLQRRLAAALRGEQND